MLTLSQADAVFAPLARHGKLLLAVSGGPDSVALMLLAAAWAGKHETRLSVATVDHGLREGSATEAEIVGHWANALGFAHSILQWSGDKPASRIQEKARAVRYHLLCEHARQTGATGLVTAHHADDQAETILFRLTKGSGVSGLSGMRAKVRRGGLCHWRPLLDFPKAALVSLCQSEGHRFFDDPSNRNERFARTGLRRLAGLLGAEGLDCEALLRLGRRAARAEDALAAMAVTCAAQWNGVHAPQIFVADGRFLANIPAEIALRLLEAEVLAVTGSQEPLRLERLERALARMLAALAEGAGLATSLGGALIRLHASGQLKITPEPPRRRGRD